MKGALDATDLDILRILEKNAKAPIHIIAHKLSLPSSTVHHRIKQMEHNGVILRWTIAKDYEKLGLGLKAHVLIYVDVPALKKLHRTQQNVANELAKIQGVEGADIIAGDADIIIAVRSKDMASLQKLLLEKIQGIDGITKTKTLMVISGAQSSG